MNEIRFDIQHNNDGNLVVPVIDGKSLISILKDFELPFAKKEGSKKIAGSYSGLFASSVKPPSRYLYGEELGRLNKKTPILICTCLFGGGWDFIADIELTEEVVIWKNFEQPYRKNWNYAELGVFTFDRKQFENALKEIENK